MVEAGSEAFGYGGFDVHVVDGLEGDVFGYDMVFAFVDEEVPVGVGEIIAVGDEGGDLWIRVKAEFVEELGTRVWIFCERDAGFEVVGGCDAFGDVLLEIAAGSKVATDLWRCILGEDTLDCGRKVGLLGEAGAILTRPE